MPRLNSYRAKPSPSALNKGRMWSHPEVNSHSLLVLTDEQLFAAPLLGVPKSELVSAINAGSDLETMLGSLSCMVNLASVRQLSLDLLNNLITIEYVGEENESRQLRLTFSSSKSADTCFTKIWRRLGEDLQLAPYKREPLQVVRAPLAMLLLTFVMTGSLACVASIREDSLTAQPPAHASSESARGTAADSRGKHNLDIMNWRVFCGIGGAVAAVSQIWLYRRLTAPPVLLKLSRITPTVETALT